MLQWSFIVKQTGRCPFSTGSRSSPRKRKTNAACVSSASQHSGTNCAGRTEADFLRDGIYELRVRLRTTNYRMLYFFHGRTAAVLSHGVSKEDQVPTYEIDRAIARKAQFTAHPLRHTAVED